MIELLPPWLVLLLGALAVAMTRGMLRSTIVVIVPLVTLWLIWQVPDGVALQVEFLGYALQLMEGSEIRRLFATNVSVLMLLGGLFACRIASGAELAAALAFAAGAVGVCFAGDLITLFLFWEVMAIFSTVIVFCGRTGRARAAGIRYAIIHLLGGIVVKLGIEAIYVQTGSIEIRPLGAEGVEAWVLLAGVLINAATPPLGAWLTDACPEASPGGSLFVPVFLTQTAVLALILLFPGAGALIPIGLLMLFWGILYGLLENDMLRLLCYILIAQVGTVLVAVGVGTQEALSAAVVYALIQYLCLGLLFLCAGAVLWRTGVARCSELGGLFRSMPLTCAWAVIGALTLNGLPITAGYIGKALSSESTEAAGMTWLVVLLALASASALLQVGIKFPWFTFFDRDSGLRPVEVPWNMSVAMGVLAVLGSFVGLYPQPVYSLLSSPLGSQSLQSGEVLFTLQLFGFSGLAFFLLLPLLRQTRTQTLDSDWLYRRLLPLAWDWASTQVAVFQHKAHKDLKAAGSKLGNWLEAHWADDGMFVRSWPIGLTALWIAVLLVVYVLDYFL